MAEDLETKSPDLEEKISRNLKAVEDDVDDKCLTIKRSTDRILLLDGCRKGSWKNSFRRPKRRQIESVREVANSVQNCNNGSENFSQISSYIKTEVKIEDATFTPVLSCGDNLENEVKCESLSIHEETIKCESPIDFETTSNDSVQDAELDLGSRCDFDSVAYIVEMTKPQHSEEHNLSTGISMSRKLMDGERYSCPECSETFPLSSQLNVHMQMHTGDKPYICALCDKCFTQSSSLKAHLHLHSGEKPFVCKQCTKSFTRLTHLKTHMRFHTGETPYQCNICMKSFKRSYHLKRHKRIHTGDRPYTCTVCFKSFTQSSSLNVHMGIHNSDRVHECNICFKSFTLLSYLKRHMQVHSSLKKQGGITIGDRNTDLNHLQSGFS